MGPGSFKAMQTKLPQRSGGNMQFIKENGDVDF